MHGEETFHPDTRALLGHGRELAGQGGPGRRRRAEHVLQRLFVFERTPDGRWPVRTCGAEVAERFGRDLCDTDFACFWLHPDQRLLAAFIDAIAAAQAPGIIRGVGETACGAHLGVELLITPLKVEPCFGERFLGMLQPLGGESFLEGRPLIRLRAGALHPPAAKPPPTVRLVVSNR